MVTVSTSQLPATNDMYGQFTLPSQTTSLHITVDAQDIGARLRKGSYPYTVHRLYGVEAGNKIVALNWDNLTIVGNARSTCLVLR